MSDAISIACVQHNCVVGEPDENITTAMTGARSAIAAGAQLVVLPELCTSGYMLADRAEAYAVAEPVPDGDASHAFSTLCQQTGSYLVAGIAERSGDELFNSAALFGPHGHIGTYRKLHLWNTEHLFFEPGNLGAQVFTTPIGRIGLAVCYDAWFPELFRQLAVRGADIVAMPVNWVPGPSDADGELPIGVTLAIATATRNGVAIAVADRVGTERGTRFLGSSALVGANGRLLTQVAGDDAAEAVHGQTKLRDIRAGRSWSPYNHLLHDRRTDVYAQLS